MDVSLQRVHGAASPHDRTLAAPPGDSDVAYIIRMELLGSLRTDPTPHMRKD